MTALDAHASTNAPRIAVLPKPTPALVESITRGGGVTVTDPAEAEGLVVDFALDPAVLELHIRDGKRARWVQLPRSGVDVFLPAIATRPDLTWTSAKGCYAEAVAEHAMALILTLLRDLHHRVRATSWGEPAGRSLHGLRVVVIGAGGVGLETVRLLKCFSTQVTVVRRRPISVAAADCTVDVGRLGAALDGADVVVVAAALTAQTRALIGSKELNVLAPGAILVNVARGELVDTEAVVAALESGKLAAAGLDVTNPEPLPEGHRLWEIPQALITPHTADTMQMRLPRFAERVTENVRRFARHQPLTGVVDVASGY